MHQTLGAAPQPLANESQGAITALGSPSVGKLHWDSSLTIVPNPSGSDQALQLASPSVGELFAPKPVRAGPFLQRRKMMPRNAARRFSASLVIAAALSSCCLVRPYVPADAALLDKDGPFRLWRGPEGFLVVATFQPADCRNEVCIFETREAAEEYYAARLAGETTWIRGCPCGPTGRVHAGDTYHDPQESNARCEQALAEREGKV